MEGTSFKDSSGEGGVNHGYEMTEQNEDGNHNVGKVGSMSNGNSNSVSIEGPSPRKRGNILARAIEGSRNTLFSLIQRNKETSKTIGWLGLFAAYNAYVAVAVAYAVRNETPMAWCDGLGLLIILTGILYWSLFYYMVLKGFFGETLNDYLIKPMASGVKSVFSNKIVSVITALLIIGGIVAFIVVDSLRDDKPERLVSAGGALVFLLVLFLLSKHPGYIQWRQVIGGLGLQFVFALAVLKWEGGKNFLNCISEKVARFLSFADEGSAFIYDFVASGKLTVSKIQFSNGSSDSGLHDLDLPYPLHFMIPTTFAFTSLSVIFFFSFVVQLLYHIGVMLWVVRKVGWLLQIIVGTSAAESMNAAANIFLGQTEAPLLIKPFMDNLTKSELHAVMTGGFATIAGTVMAAYISFGVPAESLLSASVMAAPCALALSKIMYPEIEESKTTHKQIKNVDTRTQGNALDAAAKGASEAIALVWNILANILAFVSFVAFLNAIVAWIGGLVGLDYLSFEWLLKQLFYPVAILMGVESKYAGDVAEVLGLKIVVNEFVAYKRLQTLVISHRSRRLAEYALCGFANLSSMGIQLGGLGAIAPARRADLAKIVGRALITGATASIINGCVAGALMSFDDADA